MRDALRPLLETFGQVLVRDVKPSVLKATRDRMIQSGLARKTINARINRIRRMFRWGVENDLAPLQVLQGLMAVSPLKRGAPACGKAKAFSLFLKLILNLRSSTCLLRYRQWCASSGTPGCGRVSL